MCIFKLSLLLSSHHLYHDFREKSVAFIASFNYRTLRIKANVFIESLIDCVAVATGRGFGGHS